MSYIGKLPLVGNYTKLDSLTATTTDTYALTKDSVAVFPHTPANCIVSLNGVIQAPFDSYTISGSNIVFASALTASDSIDFITVLGDVLNVGTVSDDTITTAKIQDGAITSSKLASGVGGKVLQVVQGSTSTQTSNNTTSYADTTLSASITPSSTSSKILVMLTQKLFLATGTSDRGSVKAKLIRGATDIWENATIYFQTTGISGEIDRYVCVNYLDTPSTTSSTTYKTQFAIDSTATNKIAYAQYGSTLAYITLMEIAG